MKKRISVLVVTIGVGLFSFHRWFSCWLFKDTFYFTQSILARTLLNATNEDKGVPLLVTRILHNKIVEFPWGVGQTILQYWDVRFLEELIGIIGAAGVYLGIWYLVTKYKKNIFLWVIVGAAILLQFLELFHPLPFSYAIRLIPLVLIFETLSLFGLWQFLARGKGPGRYILISILLIASILSLLLFPQTHEIFCLKV